MYSSQNQKNIAIQYEEQQMYQSITLKQIMETSPQQILKILIQKHKIIQSFSQQITKFKAEQLKSRKLVSSLQQKIQKALPSGTNTSNSFMIASEFKNLFTSFMTNTVPSVLYEFTQNPKLYAMLLRKLIEDVYQNLQNILNNKLDLIVKILMPNYGLQHKQVTQQIQNHKQQLRHHLLDYFQKNFKHIFSCKLNISEDKENEQKSNIQSQQICFFKIKLQTSQNLDQQIIQKIETLNTLQCQQTQQVKQFCLQMYQICIYMILQQNPWQFVFNQKTNQSNQQDKQRTLYTKKDFICIDGFIKQGKQVIYILKGLRRKNDSQRKQYHYHPNIKNFVLPFKDDQYDSFQNIKIQAQNLFLINQKKENQQFKQVIPLKQITNFTQNQSFNSYMRNQKLSYPPVLIKCTPIFYNNTSNDFNKNNQRQNQATRPQQSNLIAEQSFKIQTIGQTQKSQIIQSLLVKKQAIITQSQQNCIIDSTQHYTYFEENDQSNKENQQLKENFQENVDRKNIINQMHAISHSKKDKLTIDKHPIKKIKKQKNGSTSDLTIQKRKVSHKESHKDENEDDIHHKKKYDELPLTRDIPKFSKKKTVGKSSRKCSIGKIVSQSTQINGSNIHVKQKMGASQHSTMVMKQMTHGKGIKDNYLNLDSQKISLENKQNFNNFVGHMYQKQIIRPKKSTKISKNQEKHLIINPSQVPKQQRPLAMRTYQNNCLVGKLREKYLIN